jgi:tetratricopeptide (TPR) repeat protein
VRAVGLLLLSLAAASAAGAGEKGAAPSLERLAAQASAARRAGKPEEAVALYRRALARRPAWIEGRWGLASLYYDLDRYALARDEFQKVAAARPQDGTAAALLALCAFQLKDYPAAAEGLARAHQLGVASPEVESVAALHTALLQNHAGNPDAAFMILRRFAARGQDQPSVIDALGLAILRMPAMPEDLTPEQRPMVQLAGRGGYHMGRGRRTSVGRLALEELVSRFPTVPNVHYALGSYLAPDDPDRAIEEFRRELRAVPQHVPSLLQIAMIELRRGNAAAALPLAEEGARLAPDVPAAHLALGRVALEMGDALRAVTELEKGAALAPESADVQFSLARAYQRAGRGADAERARQEFIRLDKAAKEGEAAAGTEAPPQGPQASTGAGHREEGSR